MHAVLHDMAVGMRFIVHHAAMSFVVLAMAAGLFTIGCFVTSLLNAHGKFFLTALAPTDKLRFSPLVVTTR